MERELYGQIQSIERDHWWYVARRKIIFDWVQRYARAADQPRVLDIGCGTGFNIEHLHALGFARVIGLDLSSEALRFCRSRQLRALVRGDATHPPFRDRSFDLILALDLVEHVEDDVTTMARLGELLAPGGSLVIFTPAYQFLWSNQDEVSHHFRRYTARELRHKLTRAGLDVVKVSYTNTFLFPVVWAGRLSLKLRGARAAEVNENEMHPGWANGLLQAVFAAERPLLRHINLPFGVSLLTLATRRG
jgi:SAM-dependent methyltransferase